MKKRVIGALAVSIVFNVLLGGMLLGNLSHHLMPVKPFNVSKQLERLSPEKRDLFISIMEPAKKRMDEERAQMDIAKKAALKLLKAESFDGKAYLVQTKQINTLREKMKQHADETVAELAEKLTQPEREILAEIVSHPPFALPPGAQLQEAPPAPAQ